MKNVQPRPTIPLKPHLKASEGHHGGKSQDGKVKRMVLQYSSRKTEAVPEAAGEATASLCSTPRRRSVSEPLRCQESGSRSAPDGREESVRVVRVVGNSQSPAAPPNVHRGTQQNCICHPKRPGMKLVWLPEQEVEEYENGHYGHGREERKEAMDDTIKTMRKGSFPAPYTGTSPFLLPPLPEVHQQARQIGAVHNSPRLEEEKEEESVYEVIAGKEVPYNYLTVHEESSGVLHPRPHRPSPESTPLQTFLSKVGVRRTPPPPPPTAAAKSTSQPTPLPYMMRPLPPLHMPYLSGLSCVPVLPSVPPCPQPPESPSPHYDDVDERPDSVAVDMEDVEKPTYRTDSPRRISSDWEPQRQDEPLYQIYQAKATTEALHAQSAFDRTRRTTVDLQVRTEGGGGVLLPEGLSLSRRGPEEVILWQDLSVVRDSGLLETLSHEELQRQESLFEVLTSEASYLRSLEVLVDHFLMSRYLQETLLIFDKRTLFSNIVNVRAVSERFFKDLLERVDESVMITDVCDIIHRHALHNFSVYIDNIRNQGYQEKAYSSLMESNREFAAEMRRLEEAPHCRRLPFSSFLLLPFQRITRIKILVQNILRRTPEGSTEERAALLALASVSEIIKESNAQVGQMKQMEELIHVANTLEFHKLKAIPLISNNRRLEKRGEVQELSKSGSLFSAWLKTTPIYLFLFNDLLIITYKKSPERYVVTDHAHRSLVQMRPAVESAYLGSRFEHSFSLVLLENHRGEASERLLKAPSESDMHRWMAAFPSLSDSNKEESIYEDWDCPQAQCVESYIAQQADELTLEPADIINVLRKTNEGWCEGMRLCDREKGWFPARNVLEITNEHVRRRNLREQFRFAQAAAAKETESGAAC